MILLDHDIHLSVTEISVKGDNLEIVIKIFYDDLQEAMGLVPGEQLPANYAGAEDLIQKYVSKHFILRLNDQILVLQLSESVALLPAIWSTFSVKNFKWSENSSLEIENRLMINLYSDQKNIVKINLGKLRKDFIFTKSKNKIKVLF